MTENKMVLFDLDGTLWDSAGNIAKAWNIVLEDSGYGLSYVFTAESVHSVMGKTMDEISETSFPELEATIRKRLFDRCIDYENKYIERHGGVLFEGIEDMLEKLHDMGYKLAIVSNCQFGYIPAFLKSMNMEKYFCDYEEWGRTLLSKGENIKLVLERNGASKAVYVGDTEKDEEGSRLAGIPFIHATYGFGGAKQPDAVINSPCELIKVIKELI